MPPCHRDPTSTHPTALSSIPTSPEIQARPLLLQLRFPTSLLPLNLGSSPKMLPVNASSSFEKPCSPVDLSGSKQHDPETENTSSHSADTCSPYITAPSLMHLSVHRIPPRHRYPASTRRTTLLSKDQESRLGPSFLQFCNTLSLSPLHQVSIRLKTNPVNAFTRAHLPQGDLLLSRSREANTIPPQLHNLQ
jgi:hypothetical protein